jgi:hypothetical protein
VFEADPKGGTHILSERRNTYLVSANGSITDLAP